MSALNLAAISLRSQQLVARYGKYESNDEERRLLRSDDPFEAELMSIRNQVDQLNQRSEEIAKEENQAARAAGYAELRRAKANLLTSEVPRLSRVIKKGKGVTPQVIQMRHQQIAQLKEEIEGVMDGTGAGGTTFFFFFLFIHSFIHSCSVTPITCMFRTHC